MTATNHALTGAIIGLVIDKPLLALPSAFLSHIVCDIIPHYASAQQEWIKSDGFQNYLIVDALLCVLLVVLLAVTHPDGWFLAAVCAFVATSPDLLWIRKFIAARRGSEFKPGKIERILMDIQWFQRPIGFVVEAVWSVGAAVILVQLL